MRPTTLYVIGNGFDLFWHGIPSGLGAFKEYVLGTDRDIHREVEDYLPAGEDWCDLERALAELDADMLVDNLGHFMGSYGAEDWSDSGHHDFQYEVGNVVERLSTGLRMRFAEWIRALSIPTPDTAPRRLARLVEVNGIIDDYFSATSKRSEELINRHRPFFERGQQFEQNLDVPLRRSVQRPVQATSGQGQRRRKYSASAHEVICEQ